MGLEILPSIISPKTKVSVRERERGRKIKGKMSQIVLKEHSTRKKRQPNSIA